MTFKGFFSTMILLSFFGNSMGALTSQQITVTDKKGDFEAAQDHCKSLQLYLIRVESEEDNKLVSSLAQAKNVGKFWVDGNDLDVEGKWVNYKNDLLKYFKWGTGQPDNWKNNENCAEIHNDQTWNDIVCSTENAIICLDEETIPIDTGALETDDLTITDKKTEYDNGLNYCKSLGLKLLRVNNDAENKLVNDLVVTKNIEQYWVDGNDNKVQGTWVNSDNVELTYKKWAVGQPDNAGGNEHCAQINKDQTWRDVVCTSPNNVACFIYHIHRPKVSVDLKPEQVTVTDKVGDFDFAQKYCQSLGLKVIRVKNDEENKLVNSLTNAKNVDKYWVDGNNIKSGATWVNSHNLPLKYKKWAPGQPDNLGGNENCAEINKDGLWDDTTCTNQISVVCYNKDGPRPSKPTSTDLKPEDIVVTDQKGSFLTAQKYCQSLGMKLIRVNNDDENRLVTSLAVAKNIDRYWVDGSDVKTEGIWLNSDNLALQYRKWGPGQPDNFQNNEHCAEVNKDQKWNDNICSTLNGIVCYTERKPNRKASCYPSSAPCPVVPKRYTAADVVVTGKKGDFITAQNYCKSLGLSLIRIQNDEDSKYVYNLALSKKVGKYWIDGNDIRIEGSWVNWANVPLTYKKWGLGNPNNALFKEHCAEAAYDKTEMWNDIDCTMFNAIICFKNNCTCSV